ncbi:necap-like protein [Anaeramoeba flamelloides]|uniref:Necap-like protein n=1 Tax=Anaeramoeba flamelloides TaxID=1746091 RepID=A0ABQ8YVV2_9EUKA|nr:necap-like protein [Anaeramoeba flamelloides]
MSQERTLLVIPECNAFKIPPLQTSKGFTCSEWQGNHIWTGRMRIVSNGEECIIRLEDTNTDKVFGQCFYNVDKEGDVTPVIDSSRFFVLKIKNSQGRHAFIGIGFEERATAFDFNVALEEHRNNVIEMRQPKKKLSDEPKKDYSLKEGQKIKISIGQSKKKKTRTKKTTGGGLFKLAPPPKSGNSVRTKKSGQQQESWVKF